MQQCFKNAYICNDVTNSLRSMKKILLIVYLLFFIKSFDSFALLKGSFGGTVIDNITKKPIEGASIYVSDMKMGCSTNFLGEFYFSNIREGKHLIEISHIGYATLVLNIDIKGDTKKDFFLIETIIESNAVVVTGVSKATQLKKIPFQISVMRKQDLMQTSSMNIIESITHKAGVSSISSGPAVSKPLIRGLGYNRILTINDGVRQEGQQWGDEHGIEIDDASVNKIEVLKGPASLVYGSDAMAGVINIISNVPVQDKTLKMNVGSNFQSNNNLRTFNGNISGNKNGFNWNVYGTFKKAADYKNKYDGFVFNSKFNERNFGGYAGVNKGWGFSHIILSNFDLNTGLVEGERDSLGNFVKTISGDSIQTVNAADFKTSNPYYPYQHIRHFKIASDNSLKLGLHHLTFNVGWQQNRREEFGNPDNPTERALFFNLKTITYTSQFHFKEVNGWKNSLGLTGMFQSNENLGIEQLIPDYHSTDNGMFVFSQKEYHKINFSGGIRFDNRSIRAKALKDGNFEKGQAFEKHFSNFSGSAGIAYPVSSSVNIKLNIARAFRAPSIPELASNGAHEGTIRYEYGNKNLKSEISTQGDAALEYNSTHFSLNVSGFINQFQNFIFYRKLQRISGGDSMISVNGSELTAFQFDQEKALLAGAEMILDIHPHPIDWLHIENTFSLVSGTFQTSIEGSKYLPFIPAPRLITECRGNFKKWGNFLKNVYAKFEIDNTFNQDHPFTAYNTETTTKGYTLFNAGFGGDVYSNKNKQLLSLYFTASNLTDVTYQNHLSRLKYAAVNNVTNRQGVFNIGRNFGIKINIPIGFNL